MKQKAKNAVRAQRRVTPSKSAKRAGAKRGLGTSKKQFARMIWPRIKDSTKFVELSEFQTTVTYKLRSGQLYTASLNWYGVSHGPRIFGHYDDENGVCYIGKFVE